jgi:hypothetical protein
LLKQTSRFRDAGLRLLGLLVLAAAFPAAVVATSHADPTKRASGTVTATGGGTLPWLHVEGNKIKDPHGNIVVLRGISLIDIGLLYSARPGEGGVAGAIDRNTGTGWYTRVVRLPVYPPYVPDGGGYSSPNPFPFTPAGNDAYYNNILKPAVDYATSKGLYVIIDYHQIANSTGTEDQHCRDFWTYMAPKFANQSNVIYETFGEPIDFTGDPTASWSALKPRAQAWVDIIRAAAPNNLIFVGNPKYDQYPGAAALNPLTGTNLVYTAHPYDFNWSSTFQSQITTAMARVPVVFSEWGIRASSTAFGTTMRNLAEPNNISWIAWCNDWAWGPPMYTDNTYSTLNAYGAFVKQWLLDMKDSNQPVGP